MEKYAIIVAGGSGSRMKTELPKQFIMLHGKPVFQYSLEAFKAHDPLTNLILVVPDTYQQMAENQCRKYFSGHVEIVTGGATRFESVKNGLSKVTSTGWVAVHDAARPMITSAFISSLFAEAEKSGSAIPAVTVNDTIRQWNGESYVVVDRNNLRAMQTPQIFSCLHLKKAFEQAYNESFTDEAIVMESAGFRICITQGMEGNLKITHTADLKIAELQLQATAVQEY
jgi:2-C-methyl-D-erythritol 4-phosphate cytidylyltransferase